jgi:nucleotide-binding universal stress UspA family protein
MFKTIVVGVDGSEDAERAVSVAVDLARQEDARLVFAHVEQDVVGKGAKAPVVADEGELRHEIAERAKELSSQGVEATVETSTIVLGGPAHAIEEIADKAGADVIVVGTRGHSAMAGVVLGSVTQRLLHVAKRLVLAVPPAARTGGGSAAE